jgi:hypothetical protein
VQGERDAIVCVPRAELDSFLTSLDGGQLDAAVTEFLAQPPTGRILRAADQTRKTGLFDGIAAPDAIVPSERVSGPARGLGIGRGGGNPVDSRRRKRERPRGRVPRALVAGVVAAVVVAGAAIAVAASGGGGDDAKVAAVATTTSTSTTTTLPAEVVTAQSLIGTWTVTRTVVASDSPRQPVGSVTQFPFLFSSTCTATPCAVHVDMQGIIGAVEAADLAFVGDHYEGPVTGTTPCRSFTTDEVIGGTTISGTMTVRMTGPNLFEGTLDLALAENANCLPAAIGYQLAGAK